jgi:hypothetical protein
MAELKEVFEMTTKQMEPDQDSWIKQERRQRRTVRNRKIGAFAVAAAIGLAAIVVVLATRPGDNTTTPGNGQTVNPAGPTAEDVATGFLGAFGALNAEQAIAYLAEDADISGLIGGRVQGVEGNPEELRLNISFLEAVGYEQMLDTCEELGSSASVTSLRCMFHFHLFGSDEIGRGPFSGGYFDLIVRDGEIVRASHWLETEEFGPQMWEPFRDWVSATYPKDAAVMYQDESYSQEVASEESIPLWKQHIREYVKEVRATEEK